MHQLETKVGIDMYMCVCFNLVTSWFRCQLKSKVSLHCLGAKVGMCLSEHWYMFVIVKHW